MAGVGFMVVLRRRNSRTIRLLVLIATFFGLAWVAPADPGRDTLAALATHEEPGALDLQTADWFDDIIDALLDVIGHDPDDNDDDDEPSPDDGW